MSALVEWLVGGGGTATLGAVATAVVKAAGKFGKALEDAAADITYLKVKLAKETGGNSNGLRQAINEMSRDVTEVKAAVAEVRGAFNQHVKEGTS